ncbi:MAG: tRNA lysidine(34) synthetase TilS [Sphingomicrobium sp.]
MSEGTCPADQTTDRFRSDLGALIGAGERIGVAVSGGPDSLALLVLVAAVRPGKIEAATVDHGLRDGSCEEAAVVADICARLGVPHAILTAAWETKPAAGIQERARAERYRLLARWALDRGLDAVATAHHLHDQAETLLMRLARGAGVRGLAAMRAAALVPGSDLPLLRPLLGWRRAELAQVCASAGVEPATDPSNHDARFERVRIRQALAESAWLDPQALAASAANLGKADAALEWATDQEAKRGLTIAETKILYRPADAPPEIRRRIVARAVARLAAEGNGAVLRGSELDRLLAILADGGKATLRGVLCSGGETWRFVPAPNRTRRVDNLR